MSKTPVSRKKGEGGMSEGNSTGLQGSVSRTGSTGGQRDLEVWAVVVMDRLEVSDFGVPAWMAGGAGFLHLIRSLLPALSRPPHPGPGLGLSFVPSC